MSPTMQALEALAAQLRHSCPLPQLLAAIRETENPEMKLYHGIKHFAVTGRRIDWELPPKNQVEIFDSSNMESPLVVISGASGALVLRRLREETERHSIQSYLERIIADGER